MTATLASMTGFGSATGTVLYYHWNWELKSVNGKTLDVRVRLPSGWDALEADIKAAVAAQLARGNITIALTLQGQAPVTIQINADVLQAYLQAAQSLAAAHSLALPTTADLLQLRGVADVAAALSEADTAVVRAAVMAGLTPAVAALAANRASEGARLHSVLSAGLDRIATACAAARVQATLQADTIAARLRQRLTDLLADTAVLDPARLAQEVAVLVAKADVTEELDRLDGHIAAAHALLGKAEPVGRAFDFLAQEFNREVNTLCAKSSSAALTGIGLDLKALVDQMREQVQNIE